MGEALPPPPIMGNAVSKDAARPVGCHPLLAWTQLAIAIGFCGSVASPLFGLFAHERRRLLQEACASYEDNRNAWVMRIVRHWRTLVVGLQVEAFWRRIERLPLDASEEQQ